MKKLLTILTITLVTTASIFAMGPSRPYKSAEIQLNTTIDEYPVEYQLYYNNVAIEDGGYKEIEVNPLTEGDSTEDFTIRSNSNMNNDLQVEVTVEPTSFKTVLNGDEVFDSEITPRVGWKRQINTITAGKHMDYLIYVFDLAWVGNENLPAGDYVSDVNIEYTII